MRQSLLNRSKTQLQPTAVVSPDVCEKKLIALCPEQLKQLYAQLGARYASAQSAEQLKELSVARHFVQDQLAKWARLRTLAEAGQPAGGEGQAFVPTADAKPTG
jgi:hypothetical protein